MNVEQQLLQNALALLVLKFIIDIVHLSASCSRNGRSMM